MEEVKRILVCSESEVYDVIPWIQILTLAIKARSACTEKTQQSTKLIMSYHLFFVRDKSPP